MREFNCVYCGRKAEDWGLLQNKIYCSDSCCQKAYQRRKRKEAKEVVMSCKYNEEVNCDGMNCENCGWNPEVERRRKESLL